MHPNENANTNKNFFHPALYFVLLATLTNFNVHAQPPRQFPSHTSAVPVALDSYLSYSTTTVASPAVPATPASAATPVVSVNALRTPPAAQREIDRAQKSFNAGDVPAAIAHLQKAIRIAPNCAAAHELLAFRYSSRLDFPNALVEFRALSTIVPTAIEPLHDQSVMLYAMGRYPEAESAARHILDLDPVHQPTRYLLGRILVAENQFTPETIQLLRDNQDRFPAAHLALADLYLRQHQVNDCAAELTAYLAVPNAPDKPKVQALLDKCAHHTTPSIALAKITQ
jgi:tetratricopeptide (TPR) repeat protein